jgi:hypothetical protein
MICLPPQKTLRTCLLRQAGSAVHKASGSPEDKNFSQIMLHILKEMLRMLLFTSIKFLKITHE